MKIQQSRDLEQLIKILSLRVTLFANFTKVRAFLSITIYTTNAIFSTWVEFRDSVCYVLRIELISF